MNNGHAPEAEGDVTRLLNAAGSGSDVSGRLVALLYQELRRLAERKLAHEAPGQTLNATGLVHEAYLRLVGDGNGSGWENRAHFFAAAAEAMRRILVENARRKRSLKRGGGRPREEIDVDQLPALESDDQLLAINEALEKLAARDSLKAALVKLRYFAGFTIPEAAEALGISTTTADRYWSYARSWLRVEMQANDSRFG